MDALIGIFQNGLNAYIQASVVHTWILSTIFSSLSVFSLTYFHLKGKILINSKKSVTTDRLKGYASLIGSIGFPITLLYTFYQLYLIHNNQLLKVFEKLF